jgi:NADPH:quinone reductase-like Zn-dependent oxidoreductase
VPKSGEVLVKMHATTVNAGDCEMRGLNLSAALALPMRMFNGFAKPKRVKILGQDFAGEVEAVADDVPGIMPGERVFGATGFGPGTYTEYMILDSRPGDHVWTNIPDGIDYTQIAPLAVSGLEALNYLSRADIAAGEAVLINGAGGSIGSFAIQLAKYYGANVTAVDISEKHDAMKEAGADETIDFRKMDFTKSGVKYDVIFDVVGKSDYAGCIVSLNPKGRLLISNPTFGKMIRARFTEARTDKKVIIGVSQRKREELDFLKKLVAEKKIIPIIDKVYSLDEIPEAHTFAESGMKRGNIVVKIR